VVARTRHGGSIDPPQIGLASTSPDDPGYRTLVGNAADGTEIDQLSVAVDLMSLDHPTVAPVDPDWPWSPERTWATVLAVVCLGLVLVGLARGAVRRRWRPRP
jgi:hypothetical protein